MGSGGAKKKNELLLEQQRLAQQASKEAGGYKREQYELGKGRTGTGEDWLRQMWGQYGIGGEGEDGGEGGGGPAFEKLPWESEVLPWALTLMKEGAYSPEQQGILRSAATTPITAMGDMLKRGMETSAAGAGTGGGYASGLGRLFQDKAYAASEASKGAEADLLRMIAASKAQGAQIASPIESEKRAFATSERDKEIAARQAAAARGRAGREADYGERMGIIKTMLGIGDTSLGWGGQELGGVGEGRASASARVDETPMWQKMGADLLKGGAAAALGAFTGGAGPALLGAAGGLLKKKPGITGGVPPVAVNPQVMDYFSPPR